MAFNLSQIVNKFLSTKPHSTSADGWENPFASPNGQIVTTQSEVMKKRMARLGQIKSSTPVNKTALTQNTPKIITTITPTDGFIGIPLKIIVTMQDAGLVYLDWKQRPNQDTETTPFLNYLNRYFLSAGTWELSLDGEIMIGDGCSLKVTATSDVVTNNAWCSVLYAEEVV
jgi:hypothetical protein